MDIDVFLSGGPLLAVLAVLALVDSTSFGTLAVPVWLMMAPGRLRLGRILLYLGTIAAFYCAVGVGLLLGASWLLERFQVVVASPAAAMAGTVLGVGLVVFSFSLDSPAAKQRARDRAATGGGRIGRWRARATGQDPGGGVASLMGLALAAGLIEVATMLPYLAAIGLITAQGPGWPLSAGLVAGYCLVMIVPALALLTARLAAGRALESALSRLDAWFSRHSASTLAWVVGIVGVVLVVNSAPQAFG